MDHPHLPVTRRVRNSAAGCFQAQPMNSRKDSISALLPRPSCMATAILLTVGGALAYGQNLVVNGDFSANAAGYTNWPSYVGSITPGNPLNPASWTVTGGGGINGLEAVTSVFFDGANPSDSPWTFTSGRTWFPPVAKTSLGNGCWTPSTPMATIMARVPSRRRHSGDGDLQRLLGANQSTPARSFC